MCNLNFVFAGPFVILTEDISKRALAFEGEKATIKTTTFEIVFDGKNTRVTAKEAVTDAGHRWDSYPECFCKVVSKHIVTGKQIGRAHV